MSKPRNHHINPEIHARAIAMRQAPTPAEQRLWRVLRNRQVGNYKFRRQVVIGRFIVDFYCAAARLVIEIDGDSHASQETSDLTRTAWLNDQGFHVIRFSNQDVNRQLDTVVRQIVLTCEERLKSAETPSPQEGEGVASSPQRGEGRVRRGPKASRQMAGKS